MAERSAYLRDDYRRGKALDWAREAYREQSYKRYKYACAYHRRTADPHEVRKLCGQALNAHNARMRNWEQQATEDFVRPVPDLRARHERAEAARVAGAKRPRYITPDEAFEREHRVRVRRVEEGEIPEDEDDL